MRENFKLRKMKVGLVSVAITMLYIMTNGQADASEKKITISKKVMKKLIQKKIMHRLKTLMLKLQLTSQLIL